MHELMLKEVVRRCRQRIHEGDHPTAKSFSVEQLEDAVCELAKLANFSTITLPSQEWFERKIAADPDADPQAGPEF